MHFDGSWNRASVFFFVITNNYSCRGGLPSAAASSTLCEILACCWGIEEAMPFVGDSALCIEGDSVTALARIGGEPSQDAFCQSCLRLES